jgi:phage terminase large subunit-like protein
VARIIRLPGKQPVNYDALNEEQRKVMDAFLVEWAEIVSRNPLAAFEPHGPQQRAFLEARTAVVAAFAGNRFGKSTSLIVRALIECLPAEYLPERLRRYKRFDAPCHGWLLCPTEDKIFDTFRGAIDKWCPKEALKGGSWGKAFNGSRMELSFECGSTIAFKTYKQDASTLGGAALHWVGYDEPPPQLHREECMTRLIDYGGYEMFAMTPLKTNTGWIRRDIYKQREAPHITVIKGSMHDNPTLKQETKDLVLSMYSSDLWRQAREFGDFVDVGGLIYESFERAVLKSPPSREFVQGLDVVVGIDNGIRNAGFTWSGFDNDNVMVVFDELLIQDGTPSQYVEGIRRVNAKWGLTGLREPMYVIDPASKQRNQTNAETVQSMLYRLGIPTMNGQNDVEAGIQQIRDRIHHQRYWVSPHCVGLRDEADDYAAEETDDGSFKVIKGNDHRLDSNRYAAMTRPWFPQVEDQVPQNMLGFQPDRAPDVSQWRPLQPSPPMGSWS